MIDFLKMVTEKSGNMHSSYFLTHSQTFFEWLLKFFYIMVTRILRDIWGDPWERQVSEETDKFQKQLVCCKKKNNNCYFC